MDLFGQLGINVENVGRSLVAGAVGYVVGPMAFPTQKVYIDVPGLGGYELSPSKGCAALAFLTTYVVDVAQGLFIGNAKHSRLGHLPSMALHIAAGGVAYTILPGILSSHSIIVPNQPLLNKLVMLGVVTELSSQFIYEKIIDHGVHTGYEVW